MCPRYVSSLNYNAVPTSGKSGQNRVIRLATLISVGKTSRTEIPIEKLEIKAQSIFLCLYVSAMNMSQYVLHKTENFYKVCILSL